MFLLLLCLLFSGYTLYELLRPYPLRVTGPAPPREGPAVPLGEAPAGTALPPLDAFAEVVERPLFRQDRRPFVPPPPRTGPPRSGAVVAPVAQHQFRPARGMAGAQGNPQLGPGLMAA